MLDSVSLKRYMYTQHNNSGVSACYSEFSRNDSGYRICDCITLNHTLCNIKNNKKLKESVEQGWIWNCLFEGLFHLFSDKVMVPLDVTWVPIS